MMSSEEDDQPVPEEDATDPSEDNLISNGRTREADAPQETVADGETLSDQAAGESDTSDSPLETEPDAVEQSEDFDDADETTASETDVVRKQELELTSDFTRSPDSDPLDVVIEPDSDLPPGQCQVEFTEQVGDTRKTIAVMLSFDPRLPNAKKGTPWKSSLKDLFRKPDTAEISDIRVIEPSKYGLDYDPAAGLLTGTPEEDGDHEIEISFSVSHPEFSELVPKTVLLNWLVNPNPRDLWKDIPSKESLPYWKVDSDHGALEGDGYRLVGASQRGRSHAHVGGCRDDDFGCKYSKSSGWYLFAVADGAGSCEFSRKGSELVIRKVLKVAGEKIADLDIEVLEQHVAAHLQGDEEAKREIVLKLLYPVIGEATLAAYREVCDFAVKEEQELKMFSTTLLLTLARPTKHGLFFASYGIGDGGVAAYCAPREGKEAQIIPLNKQDGGAFAGETLFFTMKDFWTEENMSRQIIERTSFTVVQEEVTVIAAMTDGVTDPKFETDHNFANQPERWDMFWKELTVTGGEARDEGINLHGPIDDVARDLLEYLNFFSRGNHDDRTLILFYPHSPSA